MKTNEQLVEEFRLEFEKKRRKGIKKLRFNIILLIIGLLFLSAIFYGMYYILIILPYDEENSGAIGFCFLFVLMLLVGYLLYSSISDFFEGYNIDKLSKEEKEKLESLRKEENTSESKVKKLEEKLTKQNSFISWIKCSEVTILSPDPIWTNYIVALYNKTEESLEEKNENLESIKNQILNIEVKLEVYDKIPEKTFWQYLKSMKWFKN